MIFLIHNQQSQSIEGKLTRTSWCIS